MEDQRNFWLYAVGRLVSLIGTGVQDIAVPLFILDITESGTAMGTFMIISMVPRLVLIPLAGVVGDRVNRKLIMVWMDFGRGAVILLLAFLAAQSLVTIPILFIAQFAMSLMNALFGPATMAMLPDIVKEDDLTRANSVIGAINSLSGILGPVLGGIIYGLGGIQIAFLINGISFVASGISEVFIRYKQKTRRFEKVNEVVQDLKGGIHFVGARKGLLTLLVFALVTNFLMAPVFGVLVPYVLRIVMNFSAEQYGMIQTSFVVGLLIGNVIIGTLLAKARIEKMLNGGLLIESAFMVVFVALIFPQVIEILGYASWALFSCMFVTFMFMGVFNAFVNTPLLVGMQKLTPTEFRARVFSVVEVTAQGVVPIGFGITGILLDLAPAHVISLVLFMISLVVTVLFVFKYSKEVAKDFNNEKPKENMG
ncbi:MAG: MFS transporter [Theionarchaea archaeon]|nr:MFS transporter [Theionarchaea archaeon]